MNKKLIIILATIITLVFTSVSVFANQKKNIENIKDPIQKNNKKIKNIKAVVKIPVLMYHNITNEVEGDYVISIKDFTEQMNYLKENKYKTLSLEEYDRLINSNKPIDEKVVLLTFDDARSSVYDYVYPILKKLNYNATLFVPTGLLNTPTFMTNQQIKILSKDGFDIAGHTVDHEWLPDFSYKQQMEIIKESNNTLKEITGKNVKYMAYPYGQFDYNTVTVLDKLNMRIAFCSLDGLSNSEENPFATRRQFVYGGISLIDYIGLLCEL